MALPLSIAKATKGAYGKGKKGKGSKSPKKGPSGLRWSEDESCHLIGEKQANSAEALLWGFAASW